MYSQPYLNERSIVLKGYTVVVHQNSVITYSPVIPNSYDFYLFLRETLKEIFSSMYKLLFVRVMKVDGDHAETHFWCREKRAWTLC